MPYLMGGFPDVATSRAIGEAYADGGADLVELGVPFSDPLADGPVIQAAGTPRAGGGGDGRRPCSRSRRRSPRASRSSLMCYANLVLARGVERFATDLAAAGASGLIVPDLPLEEAGDVRAACEAAGLALVPLVAPTTPDERLDGDRRAARAASSTRSRSPARPASATRLADAYAAVVARAKAHTDGPGGARLRHRDARSTPPGRPTPGPTA